MSGWIKLEKELASDPRVVRMAKACVSLCNAPALHDASLCNAPALHGVTLVIGALARLWMYADSHARDDDSLDLGVDEIDELLGIPGFCALMPEDWLRPIDAKTVELPGFQTHNSVSAKRAALTTKRVTQHRYKVKRKSVTGGNAHAFHTKTKTKTIPRPDQDQSDEEGTGERKMARAAHTPDDDKTQKTVETPRRKNPDASRAMRLPEGFELTPERRKVAETEHLDPDRTFSKFSNHWKSASGANSRKLDWDATWRNWCLTEADRNRGGNGNGGGPRLTKFEQMQARLGDSDVDENGNPIPF